MNPPLNKHFPPEECDLLAMAYARYRGKASCIINVQEEYRDRFSSFYNLQNLAQAELCLYFHNLISKASHGDTFSGRHRSAINPEIIQAVKCARHAGQGL